jgi:hypothetical protein
LIEESVWVAHDDCRHLYILRLNLRTFQRFEAHNLLITCWEKHGIYHHTIIMRSDFKVLAIKVLLKYESHLIQSAKDSFET